MRTWLLDLRKSKGLTQLEVADMLGITGAYYSYIEKGDRQKKMDLDIAAKLSVAFDVPLEKIIELEMTSQRKES